MNQTDMIINYQNELEGIEDSLLQFYDIVFLTEQDEYRENKRNKAILGQLMQTICEDNRLTKESRESLLSSCLELLAKHTGCQEDEEIASELLKTLTDLNDAFLSCYLAERPTNRWR